MGREVQRLRGQQVYRKPPLSHADLVERMVEPGLDVPDYARAERYVRHMGYYRLSPYMIPFRVSGGNDFREGVAFDDVLELYIFDRQLRLLVLDALERVEVAVRSALTDHMSMKTGDAFWYLDPKHFKDAGRHAKFLEMVGRTCDVQLASAPERPEGVLAYESALEHYLLTYGEPELPPSWLVVESLTLGQLEHLVGNLAARSDRSAIARRLGINEPLLASWLRTFVRVRNICAHHGRLWNTVLGVYPALPQTPSVAWLAAPEVLAHGQQRRKRLYPVLVALQSLLSVISPGSGWASRLVQLLEQHPRVSLEAMGFPPDWVDDPFWSSHLGRPAA